VRVSIECYLLQLFLLQQQLRFASVWLSYYMNDPEKQYYYAIKMQNPEYYNFPVACCTLERTVMGPSPEIALPGALPQEAPAQ
jgi:hypothetical protein